MVLLCVSILCLVFNYVCAIVKNLSILIVRLFDIARMRDEKCI
jgi:hypothetical protein